MISLLLINYRASPLAVNAIRSARAATREQLQVVVVDNSCDAAEAAALKSDSDILIASERNLGYAGGINRGRRECRGEFIVVTNPDVIFQRNAIDELIKPMERSGAAVAGPALFWDTRRQWMLPPADLVTIQTKLDEALASRMRFWSRWRDKRRFRARLRFWSLAEPARVRAISGAVMAVRASTLDAVGGFDERFALYFEETDFLGRVAKGGETIVYVPASHCRHLFNQSAGSDPPRSAALFAESERRYLDKWIGTGAARFLRSIQRSPRVDDPEPLEGPVEVASRDVVVEASPLPSFATAAGHFPDAETVTIPDEVWDTYRGDRLFLRVLDRKGRIQRTYVRQRT